MVRVTSEIGRLRRVLVHEPGPEVDRMVPAMMEELLFDDILFGERAREEHRRFRRLMKLLDIEVVEARSLLAEALAQPEAPEWMARVIRIEAPLEADALTGDLEPDHMVATIVEGALRVPSDDDGGIEIADLFRLTPLPNWCFQRDPQVVVGDGVILSAMATPARWREGILSRCIFRFHPDFRDTPVLADPLRPDWDPTHLLGLHRPRLEGGDVLVLSPDMLAVGVSERTNMQAVDVLVDALARRDDVPRWLEVVHLPNRRAYMHLDTVFTPADRNAALVYAPVMTGSGPEAAVTYEVDLHAEDPRLVHRGEFLPTLAERGLDLEPIPCGGGDPVAAQREQWTDGANTMALAPGIITLYDRNVATVATLADRGFRILDAEDILLGREDFSLEHPGRCCLLLASHEISRARGGPHCLTHPLVRDDLS